MRVIPKIEKATFQWPFLVLYAVNDRLVPTR